MIPEQLHEEVLDIGREVGMCPVYEVSIKSVVDQFPGGAILKDVADLSIEAVLIADDYIFPTINSPGKCDEGCDTYPKNDVDFFAVAEKI